LQTGMTKNRPEAARAAYSDAHSFRIYAKDLCDAIGLDVAA
jgi:hypothetical protein